VPAASAALAEAEDGHGDAPGVTVTALNSQHDPIDARQSAMAKRLLIVWWSLTGGSRQLAHAAAAGAHDEPDVEVIERRADEAGGDDVLAADALLFVMPENLGSMAGMMKDFFDRSYYAVLDQVNGRPYAVIVCAGSDGQGAARQVARIATGWRMKEAAPPLIVLTHAQTPEKILAPKTIDAESLDKARELGTALASGLALGIW